MRTFNQAFGAVNASARRERRFALRIEMADGVLLWIVSHADVTPGTGTTVTARIRKLSNLSQRLRPTEGRSEIGALSFTITDIGAGLTAELRAQLLTHARGALGKRVQLYVGDRRIPFSAYELVTTQTLQSCKTAKSGTELSFQCADVQRGLRRQVFEAKETRLAASISDTDTTIPVVDATVIPGVDHGSSYSDAPDTAGVIYIRIDDEIIRTLVADRTSTTYEHCVRGVLGTRAEAHTTDEAAASSPDKGKKVEEVIYLEAPAVKLVHAIQTGVLINQAGTWPEHWFAGLVADDVKLTDYMSIGADVYDPDDDTAGIIFRFVDPGPRDAKRFIETELLRPAGLFQPVLADGQLGMRRVRRVVAGAGVVDVIGDGDLLAAPDIDIRGEDVRNDLVLRWNEVDGELTRSVAVLDEGSQGRWGAREQHVIEARGLHGSRNSRARVVAILQQAFDRRSSPPLTTKAQVSTRKCGLELGDLVRLSTSHARLWTGALGPVDHPFEIQGITTDWIRGRLTFDLESSSEIADPLKPLGTDTSIAAAWFTAAGTNIAGLAGVVDRGSFLEVTEDLHLSGDASLTAATAVYYAAKDLTIASGVTVTYDQNVQIRVLGVTTLNGKLDGKGRGLPGVADTFPTAGIVDYPTQPGPVDVDFQTGQAGGFGSTQAHGGLIERVRQENEGSRFFGVLQSVPAPVTLGAFDVMPLFQLEYRDGGVQGLPDDLRGSSGGPGGLRYYEDTRPAPNLIQVNRGGTGGAGGAGLAIVCRGFAFGASGQIDSSGNDGLVGAYNAANVQPAHAGGGAGGAPGGVLIVVDGRLNPVPGVISGKVIADYGTSPLPSSTYTQLPDSLIIDTKFGFGFEVPDDRFTRDLSSTSGIDAAAAATRIQFMPSGSVADEDLDERELAGEQVISLEVVEAYADVTDGAITRLTATVTEVDTTAAYSHAAIYVRPDGTSAWRRLGGAEPSLTFDVPADSTTLRFVAVPVLANGLEAPFSSRTAEALVTVTEGAVGISATQISGLRDEMEAQGFGAEYLDGLVAELAGSITESELATALASRIDLIDAADTVVGSVNKRLADATQPLTAALADVPGDIAAAVAAERALREQADFNIQSTLGDINTTLAELQNTPAFGAAESYAIGDLVTFAGSLWRAEVALTGPGLSDPAEPDWTLVGEYSSLAEAVAAQSGLISSITMRLDDIYDPSDGSGDLTVLSGRVTAVETAIPGLVTSTTFEILEDTVTASGTGLEAAHTRITGVQQSVSVNLIPVSVATSGSSTSAAWSYNTGWIPLAAMSVDPGEVLSISAETINAIGRSQVLRAAFRLEDGSVVGPGVAPPADHGAAGPTLLKIENVTVPADARDIYIGGDNNNESSTALGTIRRIMLNRGPVAMPFDAPRASATAYSALQSTVSALTEPGGEVYELEASFTDYVEQTVPGLLADKADLTAFTALSSSVTALSSPGNPDAITIDQSYVVGLEADLADRVTTSAFAGLQTRVTDAEGEISTLQQDSVSLSAAVDGKADGAAFEALRLEVEDGETGLAVTAAKTVELEARLDDPTTGLGAKASTTYVDQVEADAVSAAAGLVESLEAAVGVGLARGDNLLSTLSDPDQGVDGWTVPAAIANGVIDYYTLDGISVRARRFEATGSQAAPISEIIEVGPDDIIQVDVQYWSEAGGGTSYVGMYAGSETQAPGPNVPAQGGTLLHRMTDRVFYDPTTDEVTSTVEDEGNPYFLGAAAQSAIVRVRGYIFGSAVPDEAARGLPAIGTNNGGTLVAFRLQPLATRAVVRMLFSNSIPAGVTAEHYLIGVNVRRLTATEALAASAAVQRIAAAKADIFGASAETFTGLTSTFDAIDSAQQGAADAISGLQTSVTETLPGLITAEADRIDAIVAQVDDPTTGLATRAGATETSNAIAAGVTSAVAQATQQVYTSLGGDQAAVETKAQSWDGAGAQWSVKTDVGSINSETDGRVGGIGLYNDGEDVYFLINASKLAVFDGAAVPSEVTDAVPFLVDNGVTYIKQASVERGDVFDLAIGNVLQSDNYAAGLAGFRISQDGTVEFNGGTFRGQVAFTGGSGIANLSDAGALATRDGIDYDELGGAKPPTNATAGATWGGNITGQPTDAQLLNDQQLWEQVTGAGRPEDDADRTGPRIGSQMLNPEFEAGAIGWSGINGAIVVEVGQARLGDRCLRVNGPASFQAVFNQTFLQCEPGDRILFGCFVRPDPGTSGTGFCLLRWVDSAGGFPDTNKVYTPGNFAVNSEYPEGQWSHARQIATVPAGMKAARFFLDLQGFVGRVDGCYMARIPRDTDIQAVGGEPVANVATAAQRANSWVKPGQTTIDGNKIFTGDAYVDTLQIQGSAVTVPVVAHYSGPDIVGTGFAHWKQVVDVTIEINVAAEILLFWSLKQKGQVSGPATWGVRIRNVTGNADVMSESEMKAVDWFPSGSASTYQAAGTYTFRLEWYGYGTDPRVYSGTLIGMAAQR